MYFNGFLIDITPNHVKAGRGVIRGMDGIRDARVGIDVQVR